MEPVSRFLPKIAKVCQSITDCFRNWSLLWDGAIADNRSIKGRDGEYRVQVQPPLKVTDEGIILDLSDLNTPPILKPGTAGTPVEMDWADDHVGAYTDTWDRTAQPDGYDGVKWKGGRMVWDATNHHMHFYTREVLYDNKGALVSISAEVDCDVSFTDCTGA